MPPFINTRRVMTPPAETKPMVQFSVLWGLAAIALPALTEACKFIGALPPGTIPLPMAYGVAAIGWGLALYGRLYGSNKPIEGVFTTPKP